MSLLSAIILPKLEKELIVLEPEIAKLLFAQAKSIGMEITAWAEKKLQIPASQPSDAQ